MPENHNIGCGHGVTVPKDTRCLYNLDEFWNIIGCRNLAHLQDCGKARFFLLVDLRDFFSDLGSGKTKENR